MKVAPIDPTPQRTVFFESARGVFQGGGCRAVALAGALEAAAQHGVNFTAVAGASAGSIVAALIGAGAKPDFVLNQVSNTDLSSLLTEPSAQDAPRDSGRRVARMLLRAAQLRPLVLASKYLKWGGLHSSSAIEQWIERLLRQLLPTVSGTIQFQHLPIPTYIVATDVRANRKKVWSTADSPNQSVAFAVRASCSIPIFFQPATAGTERFVDGGMLSNLPAFVFSDTDSTVLNSEPILAFLLRERESLTTDWDPISLLRSLAGCIVDGATDLQLGLNRNVSTISIDTGSIRAIDFGRIGDAEKDELLTSGRAAATKFFQNERENFVTNRQDTISIRDEYELYHALVLEFATRPTSVFAATLDTRWVWRLYPSLLGSALANTPIHVLLPRSQGADQDELWRRNILRDLGVCVEETDEEFSKQFLFIHSDSSRSSAIVETSKQKELRGIAMQYVGAQHHSIIRQLCDGMKRRFALTEQLPAPSVQACDIEEIVRRLIAGVPQYREARFQCLDVEIKSIDFNVKHIRSYKYRQIQTLSQIFAKSGIPLFDAARVNYHSGNVSYVTPPVLEKNGDRLFVVEGNTRVFHCWRAGIPTVKAIVVDGVSAPLPSNPIPIQRVQLTSSRVDPDKRFEKLRYGEFRHIEAAVQQAMS